jgi:hypothetical protein
MFAAEAFTPRIARRNCYAGAYSPLETQAMLGLVRSIRRLSAFRDRENFEGGVLQAACRKSSRARPVSLK